MADRQADALRAQPAPGPEAAIAKVAASAQGVRLPPADRRRRGGRDHRRPHAPAGRPAPRPRAGAGARRPRPHARSRSRPTASPTTAAPRRPPGTSSCCRSSSTELAGLELRPRAHRLRRPTSSPRFLAEPTEGLTDPDEVPELPEEPMSKPGDLYLLGEHRLLCGDATERRRRRAPDGGQEGRRLMATDPPYLVDYQGGAAPGERGQRRRRRARTSTGTPTSTTSTRSSSTSTSCAPPSTTPSTSTPPSTSGSASCAPRSSGRAGARSACCPTRC